MGRDSGSVLPATVMAIAVLPAIGMLKAILDFGATLKLSQMMTVSSDASPPAGMTSVHGVAYCTVHGPFCSSAFAAPLAFRLACYVGDLFYYFLVLPVQKRHQSENHSHSILPTTNIFNDLNPYACVNKHH